ncbi:MAG TPA: FkbM family methyltransferase [Lacipirellulaceae bacterium]|nr:FkbM family methyltransferase [Lacipirellulaceae bacterium]
MSLARLFRRRAELPFAEWGWKVRSFDLPGEGRVQFAQWLHPATATTTIVQDEVDALRQWIRPGDFAIDVGAHTGDTTVPMALAAGRQGCVLALEPNRYAFAVLAANARLNTDVTQIKAVCCAATQQDGNFEFLYGDASFCNGGAAIGRWNPFRKKYPLPVTGRNLLTMLRKEYAAWVRRLAYVKVDAEGHDLSILRSILPVITERRPVVRTEVFKKLSKADRQAMHAFFTSAGYDVYRYAERGEPQGDAISPQGMCAARHFDILAMPRRKDAKRRAA